MKKYIFILLPLLCLAILVVVFLVLQNRDENDVEPVSGQLEDVVEEVEFFPYTEYEGEDPVNVPLYQGMVRTNYVIGSHFSYAVESTVDDVLGFYRDYAEKNGYEFKHEFSELTEEERLQDKRSNLVKVVADNDDNSFTFSVDDNLFYEGYVDFRVYW